MRGIVALGAALAIVAASPASAQEAKADAAAAESNVDPWQPFNRHTFKVYLFFDDNVVVPVAKGYRAVAPADARQGLRNFLGNSRSANTLANDVLQGEFKRGGQTLARFLINTTIGFFGAGDPAKHLGIPGHTEDFGQTLAVWGVPQGPFLYLPVIGPSTVRDAFGFATDIVVEPLFWIDTNAADYAGRARFASSVIAFREPAIEPLAQIRSDSLDYYASLRSFYLQARKREIANGRQTFEDLPDIGDFGDELADPDAPPQTSTQTSPQ